MACAARTLSHCHAQAAPFDRAPLLRFRPLQRVPTAMRCPGRPSLRTIPLRRSSPPLDPRVRGLFEQPASPLRFSALRMRCGEARYADVLPLAVSHTKSRRVNATAQCARNATRLSIASARIDRWNRFDRAQKRPVTSSATASLIRRSQSVMHRRVALARCSATDSSLRGLAGRVVLPSARPAALLGSTALRRFAPAAG